MTAQARTVVEASLDDLRSDDVRFLQVAAGYGSLHVRVPSDALVARTTGSAPHFPAAERLFLAQSIRWVNSAEVAERPVTRELDQVAARGTSLVVREEDGDAIPTEARAAGLDVHAVSRASREGFPLPESAEPGPGVPRVVVTGCYDWLHSGHIRFFMDAAEYGALYAVVGSDRNVELLKGPGHPLQREAERRYMVGSVASVHRCLISSGSGWMDAEPEVALIGPQSYVVNEDGDQPEKREFCEARGIEYVVLSRVPHAGLPARSSTDLRGFRVATLLDVAKRAGVSPMTVSRVVNGSPLVSPKLRARVEAALAETGYMPNTLARGLRAKHTDTIALLLPDMTNPFFTTLAHGVETAAREVGLTMILANSDENADEELRLIGVLLQRQVDGLLVVPSGGGTGAASLCREQGVHLVYVDRRPEHLDVDVVRADSGTGSLELGRLLVRLGHRRMSILSGPSSVLTARDRAAGFRRALVDEAGLSEPRIIHGAFTIESGREMATEAMGATPPPSALFAANNFIAIGVLHALEELGLRVPEDVAVVGFDDLPSAMVTFPFLTVAAQPAFEMGRQGVTMLLDRLADPDRAPREVILPTELVVRRSSGDPIAAV